VSLNSFPKLYFYPCRSWVNIKYISDNIQSKRETTPISINYWDLALVPGLYWHLLVIWKRWHWQVKFSDFVTTTIRVEILQTQKLLLKRWKNRGDLLIIWKQKIWDKQNINHNLIRTFKSLDWLLENEKEKLHVWATHLKISSFRFSQTHWIICHLFWIIAPFKLCSDKRQDFVLRFNFVDCLSSLEHN